MRIACPACNAAYEVPDRLIAPGRRLRCARCGHDWAVLPPAAPAAEGEMPPAPRSSEREVPPTFLEAPPLPEPPPHPALRRAPQVIDPLMPQGEEATTPRFALGLWAAWAASIMVVLLFVAALVVFRVEIAAAWPPAARLYTALGLNIGG